MTTTLTGDWGIDFEMGVLTRGGGGGSGKRRDCPLGHQLVRAVGKLDRKVKLAPFSSGR